MAEMAGVKMSAVPKPRHIENERIKCQYCVDSARAKVPPSKSTEPMKTSSFGPLASKMGPICRPQKKDMKI